MEPSREQAHRRLADARALTSARLAELWHELVELHDRRRRSVAQTVAELTRQARDPTSPADLRAVQRRIDNGELTWERVALDPTGPVGLDRLLGELPRAFQLAARLTDGEGLAPEQVRRRLAEEGP